MADTQSQAHSYACPCLNVRISSTNLPANLPELYAPDPNYTPVSVDDDGISITHLRATVRLVTAGVPIPGTSRSARFAILVCLFCNLHVYRVPQAIPQDADGHESILLPTEDWVEQDVLKSSSGTIDVHKSCLVDQAIADAESAKSYVAALGLHLSQDPPSPPPSPKIVAQRPQPQEPPAEPTQYVNLKPIFLPPPYTPSNPVFVLLASLATRESNQLRADSEKRILDFIKAETAALEEKERRLKHRVMAFWNTCRVNIQAIHADRVRHPTTITTNTAPSTSSANPRSPSRGRQSGAPPNNSGTSANSSSVMIRNFVPVASPTPLSPSRINGTPKISALSASLVTSGFHHPRERAAQNNDTTAASSSSSASTHSRSSVGSNDSGSSRTVSSNSGSSTLVHQAQPTETSATTILRFKRNINDNINTAASYQYFVNIEEDMMRHRKQQEDTRKRAIEQANLEAQEAGPSHRRESPAGVNGHKKSVDESAASPSTKDRTGGKEKETTPSRGRDKGKRKVTFDVQPAVLTIKEDHKGEEQTPSTTSQQELIFDLEDEQTSGPTHISSSDSVNESQSQDPSINTSDLPPVSQPNQSSRSLSRSRKQHSQSTARAMEAFASLRPASLPNPSYMRSRKSPPGVDVSQGIPMSMPRQPSQPKTSSSSSLTSATHKDDSPPVAGAGPAMTSIVEGSEVDAQEGVTTSTSSLTLATESENRQDGEAKDFSVGPSTTPGGPPLSERDVEILRLVAANAPSHRGAWNPDGKVWKTFTKKGYKLKSEAQEEDDNDEDESEEDDEANDVVHPTPTITRRPHIPGADMVVGSLPMPILKKGGAKVRVPLSLASYKPEAFIQPSGTPGQEGSRPVVSATANVPAATSITPVSATTPTPTSTVLKAVNGTSNSEAGDKHLSSAAIHKALYAERDIARAMDPGALDFAEAAGDDDEDDDDDEGLENLDEALVAEAGGDKSKLHALRILQKRNAVPGEGMWRSLAS